MKVKIEESFTLAELKPKLEAQFPDYKVAFRGPKVLIVSQGKVAAAQILGGTKKSARVIEGFPTMGGQMLFTLSILLLGILIPFIVYLSSMKPKQVKIRNAVADFIAKEYGNKVVVGSTDLLDN